MLGGWLQDGCQAQKKITGEKWAVDYCQTSIRSAIFEAIQRSHRPVYSKATSVQEAICG
jgi:hypothetical protein